MKLYVSVVLHKILKKKKKKKHKKNTTKVATVMIKTSLKLDTFMNKANSQYIITYVYNIRACWKT